MDLSVLKELTQLFGPSGHEEEVRNYLLQKYEELGLTTLQDPFGNVFGLKKSLLSNPKKVLLLSHMDEVGFVVTKILENGTVKVTPLGGFNSETILSSRAILKKQNGEFLYGTALAVPPHLLTGKGNDKTSIEDMCFDFGFISKEEAKKEITIGDPLILEGKFSLIASGKRVLSKALDDRMGLAMAINMLPLLKKELPFDLYLGGSCQEEVGLRGAKPAVNFIKPDFVIVIDCSPATETEEGSLNHGVLLRVFDRAMIARKDLIQFQKNVLEEHQIPYQYYISKGGTDAGEVHQACEGIPTLTYCLCARAIHTPSSVLDVKDFENAVMGLKYLLESLSNEDIAHFRYEK